MNLFEFYIELTNIQDNNTYKVTAGLVVGNLESLLKIKEYFLHERELFLLATYTYPQKILSYLLGRIAGKIALSAFTRKLHYPSYWIRNRVCGAPFFEQVCNIISISHTNNIGTAAVSDKVLIGIDIERVKSFEDFHDDQIILPEELKSLPEPFMNASTLKAILWTSKEALVKRLSTGFLLAPSVLKIDRLVNKEGYFEVFFKEFHNIYVVSFVRKGVILSICLDTNLKISRYKLSRHTLYRHESV